jgi:alpha-1,3(6)-mannosylglycoprotein beta-1,6-N-acetyl-glucosaminyltransferase
LTSSFAFFSLHSQGWVPKPNIKGHDDKIFILDFFGSKRLRGSGLLVPPERFLTAFISPGNSFLGFQIGKRDNLDNLNIIKENQGVIWGKDVKHYHGKVDLLKMVANQVPLYSTASSPVFQHKNIRWMGHQSRDEWLVLLAKSKFLLGLGDPLLGPSAIDAISVGCMYLNPIYDHPVREIFTSQHPYAETYVGQPYVCSFHISQTNELMQCVDKALTTTLGPLVPEHFQESQYLERLRSILGL